MMKTVASKIGLYSCILIMLSAAGSALAMNVVSKGKPVCVIVTAKDAPKMVQFAASELQTYIQKITGAKIAIQTELPSSDKTGRIFVGESSYTRDLGLSPEGLSSDGFKMVTGKNWLALFGKETEPVYGIRSPFLPGQCLDPKTELNRYGETGALYAVYRFLEDNCGVRWYMPGDLGEVVPKKSSIKVGNINYKKSPDYEYRFVYFNHFDVDSAGALWYRRAGFGARYPVSINHSLSMLFRKYRETHPEYFAMVRGQRDFDTTCGGMGSFCLTNPDFINQVVLDVRDYFNANPDQRMIPLMPDDGYYTVCECAACQARVDKSMGETGIHSNHVWAFIDAVATEVYKTHPDKLIGCAAYEKYLLPPTTIAKLSPNVAVMVAKSRVTYRDPKEKQKMNALIDAWGQKAGKIFFWEYYLWTGRDFTLRGMPVFFPRLVSEDLKRWRGISGGEFLEAESWRWRSYDKEKINMPGLIHPVYYVQGKLYWDADWDVKAGMEEYYSKFYGPARAEMKSFWTLGERIYMGEAPGGYVGGNLTKLLSLLDRGIAKTKKGSVERKRIELIRSEFAPSVERIKRITSIPKMTVPHVEAPPKIDCSLDDSCWRNAFKVQFVDLAGEKAEYKTDAYFTCDDANFYLAFVNEEPNTARMVAEVTERDGASGQAIWDDESIDIYIDTDPSTQEEYYQWIVNTRGALWDCHQVIGSSDYSNPANWNSTAEVQAKVEDGRWIVEMKIPFKDIGITDPAKCELKANFYRMRVNKDVVITGGTGITTGWSPTLWPFNYAPERLGIVKFEKW